MPGTEIPLYSHVCRCRVRVPGTRHGMTPLLLSRSLNCSLNFSDRNTSEAWGLKTTGWFTICLSCIRSKHALLFYHEFLTHILNPCFIYSIPCPCNNEDGSDSAGCTCRIVPCTEIPKRPSKGDYTVHSTSVEHVRYRIQEYDPPDQVVLHSWGDGE